mgnify:FL=1
MKNEDKGGIADSQSVKKVFNQLQKTIDTEWFQSEILKIRSELGVPSEGFTMTKHDRANLGSMFYIPDGVLLRGEERKTDFLRNANILIRPLIDRLVVKNTVLSEVIKSYLFYDVLEIDSVAHHFFWREKPGLCELYDQKMALQERFANNEDDEALAMSYVTELTQKSDYYPVVIRLHPEAGQRDIVDYVKKNWDRIKQVLSQYEVDRRKSVKNTKIHINSERKKIADFVYRHRQFTLKEIKAKLKDEMGISRSYEEIGKIKSLEIKRRQ